MDKSDAQLATRDAPTCSMWEAPVAIGELVRKGQRQGIDGELISDAERKLARRVRAHLEDSRLTIALTNNRYTMIAVKRAPRNDVSESRSYDVRLHYMFADADPVITRALAHYIAHNDREASRILGEFIDANNEQVTANRRGNIRVVAGEFHDLRAIYDDVNARYFGGRISAGITWGPRLGVARRRASVRMGTYAMEEKLIRIHRALDRVFVPRVFVEWVVFHEMLHEVHGVGRRAGRREFHSPAFLADERTFAQYAECKRWERTNLDRLLFY